MKDIEAPTTALLRKLNLLGIKDELDAATGFASAFTGPPQSVALIESGATAASKWWAAGLGTSVVATWGAVAKWMGGQEANVKVSQPIGRELKRLKIYAKLYAKSRSSMRNNPASSIIALHMTEYMVTEPTYAANFVGSRYDSRMNT